MPDNQEEVLAFLLELRPKFVVSEWCFVLFQNLVCVILSQISAFLARSLNSSEIL